MKYACTGRGHNSCAHAFISSFNFLMIDQATEWLPASPPSGPQKGIDRPGNDLPGFPVTLPSADYSLCAALCANHSDCVAWAYALPGCDQYSTPQCWLKSADGGQTENSCRVSASMGARGREVQRPYLNGGFLFMAGWLDQSFWPDGLYTAPTDEALRFDLEAVKMFGLNTVRLHQKVNSERWYWYADSLGIIILQDAPQKYGGATQATIAPFTDDLTRMVRKLYNHPSIIQWDVFNEEDCVGVFNNVSDVIESVRQMDPSRLVNTNSGGPANDLHVGDVNDVHNYPYPQDPKPSRTQYAMIGEFGGIGAYVAGHEWVPNQCTCTLCCARARDVCCAARARDVCCASRSAHSFHYFRVVVRHHVSARGHAARRS